MVAGHLQEKNGIFYAVLSYKDSSNKRKTKWIPTGLPVKGNKKKAEAFLMEQRRAFESPEPADSPDESDEPFDVYLWRWLQVARSTIAITTYSSYLGMLRNPICPWFQKRGVTDRQTYSGLLHGAAQARLPQYRHSLPRSHPSGAQVRGQDRPAPDESGG